MYGYPYHYRREYPQGLIVIDTAEGPIIPIETLRAQVEQVAIDPDTDAASGESHPDDPLLLSYLEAAIDYVEDYTGLSIAQRTYEIAMDAFPSPPRWYPSLNYTTGIPLPMGPVVRVLSFTAVGGGSEGELDEGDDFIVDMHHQPTTLRPVTTWPNLLPSTNNVKIQYLAGYRNGINDDSDFTEAQMLPPSIKHALLLLVAHYYENREASNDKAMLSIPFGVTALLDLKRKRLGMA